MNQNKIVQLLKAFFVSAAVLVMFANPASAMPGFGNGAACSVCHSNPSSPNSGNVLPCPAGQSRDAVTHLCTAPPPVACTGDTIGTNGMSPCTPCPAGQTANATHTACMTPPPAACTGNTTGPNGMAPCTECPTGQVANATHTACMMPPPVACTGNTTGPNGMSPCTPCPTGQTANATHTVCMTPSADEDEMEHQRHDDHRMRGERRSRTGRDD